MRVDKSPASMVKSNLLNDTPRQADAVDFIDAYNASWMNDRRILDIYTFDKKYYTRLEGISVHVPGEEGI